MKKAKILSASPLLQLSLSLPGAGDENVQVNYPSGEGFDFKFTDVASIINEALKYIFPFAGLILFFILIGAGFQFLTAAGNEEKVQKASKTITAALIGFIIIFVSFWLIKLLETVLGADILGTR